MNISNNLNKIEFDNLVKYYSSGDHRKLKDLSEELLSKYPEDSLVNMFYGVSFFQNGNFKIAEEIIKKSINYDSNNGTAYNFLGLVQDRLGKNSEALKSFLRSSEINTNDGSAFNNISNLYRRENNFTESLKFINKALDKDNKNISFMINKVTTLIKLNYIDEAYLLANEVKSLKSDNAVNLNNMGIIMSLRSSKKESLEFFKESIGLDSNYLDARINLLDTYCELNMFDEMLDHFILYLDIINERKTYEHITNIFIKKNKHNDGIVFFNNLEKINGESSFLNGQKGNLYRLINKNDEAIKEYLIALEQNKNDFVIHNDIGALYAEIDELKLAEEHLMQALRGLPDEPAIFHNLGNFMKISNKLDKANHYYRKALNLDPLYFDSLHSLLRNNGKVTSEEIKNYETIFNSEILEDDIKSILALSLADFYERNQEFDKSMKFYLIGNELIRKNISFDIDEQSKYFISIQENFNIFRKNITYKKSDNKTDLIFVLGLPRSGSTLIEQILSSHSKVLGAGEIDFFQKIIHEYSLSMNSDYPFSMNMMNDSSVQDIKEKYIKKISKLSKNGLVVVDKNLSNSLLVGLIKTIFPDAKIINAIRNPREHCFSMFTIRFTGDHSYTYDLNELAKYFIAHKNLMNYWKDIFPGSIYDVSYEDVVLYNEKTVKELLNHCNLPFEKSCLEFYKNERPVKTASASQVRQKLYKSSINRSENFKNHLLNLESLLDG